MGNVLFFNYKLKKYRLDEPTRIHSERREQGGSERLGTREPRFSYYMYPGITLSGFPHILSIVPLCLIALLCGIFLIVGICTLRHIHVGF